MKVGLLLAALVALVLFVAWRMIGPPDREAYGVVRFDKEAVTVRLPDLEAQAMRWRDLVAVEVLTTDEGPLSMDVYWVLWGADGAHVWYPNGADGEGEMIAEMQRRLPGFQDSELRRAMGSTSNAVFALWGRRPPGAEG